MEKIPVRHIQETMKEPALSGSWVIRDVEELLGGKDMVQELHRHDFYYLLALKKGSGTHDIDFTPYEIQDHSVFLMRPAQVHRIVLKTGSTGFLMQFRDELHSPHDKISRQVLRQAGAVNHYTPDAGVSQKLLSLLQHIFIEFTNKQKRYLEVVKANLDIFLIELVRQQQGSVPDRAGLYSQEKLEQLLELLELHVFRQKQVSFYTAALNLSTYQLNAITRGMLGKTCAQLIDDFIVLEAKRYLLATSSQINQIAYHLGYEDASYFIRFFKKHTEHSPEAFRQKFR